MLDTDSPDNTTSTSDSAPEPAAAAPRKRAPRKATARKTTLPAVEIPDQDASTAPPPTVPADAVAPRKRAPRKSAAKKAVPTDASVEAPVDAPADAPVEAAAATAAPETASAPDASATAAATAPAKRAPRRRATKAASAPAPAPDAEPSAAAAPAPVTTEATAPVPADETAPAPAKRAPRKRAIKKAAAEPAAENAADIAGTTDTTDPAVAAPAAMSTPGVLFIAPEPTEPEPAPRRRRTSKKAAAAAVDAPVVDDTATLEPDAAPAAADTDDAATTDDEADPDDVREAAIEQANGARRRRRRGRRGRGGAARSDDADEASSETDDASDATSDDDSTEGGSESGETADESGDDSGSESSGSSRRRRRRRRSTSGDDSADDGNDPPNTVTHVREKKSGRNSGDSGGKSSGGDDDGVRGIKGSTRLEAKRQRRRDGRETTRRRAPILTEAEFLARREAVDRVMAVRQLGDRTQIAVLEDDILVEHYVTRASATSYVGNVYLGKVQNVLPSMEAAFIDIGKGRNGVLYAGEVNWDAAGLDGKSRTIEHAMKSGDSVLVQVTKDPIGHKGARLTSQVSLPGRFLVYVPGGGMTGISRRLPDTERHRLKAILKKIVPDEAGVIVRTAAEGASEEDLTHDVERLQAQWESIETKAKDGKSGKGGSPVLLHGEPDLAIRVVRDVFNEDFAKLVVEGDDAWATVSEYVGTVAPDLAERASRHTKDTDLFHDLRVDEQLAKALDRKVWLPSGGSLVIDRTEAMTVVDVNTGRYVGSGGNLEQTVTRNNLEAAEEIVRQLRLRDVGGIVVIDFIDMVLESNRDLVLRRLTECLGRDRTKHQVAEVTSLGLVQMTRKRVGEGLLEAFSEPCEHCHGRGVIVHGEPVDQGAHSSSDDDERSGGGGRKRGRRNGRTAPEPAEVEPPASPEQRQAAAAAITAIHRATSATDDAAGGDSSALDTLASDLVNAAMEAGSTSVSANGRHEVESNGAGPTATPAEPEAGELVSSPSEAEPAATAPGPTEAAAAEPAPPEVTPPGRRRRRAASRPAGPPVNA